MRLYPFVVFLPALLILLTACTQTERQITPEELSGTFWILESVPAGSDLSLEASARPKFILFSGEGRISGFAGCNNFTGDYALEGGTLSLMPSATTMRACIPGKEDNPFISMLERANGAALEDGKLKLYVNDQTLATFKPGTEEDTQPGPASVNSLENTRWELSSVRAAEVPTGSSEKPFLTFLPEPENRLQGFGGCNNFSTTYAVENGGLSLKPVMSTKKACPDMATEEAFLQALQEIDGYSIQGDRLLLTANGEVLITLNASS